MPQILVVYQFGASDLQSPGDRFPRGVPLSNRVSGVLGSNGLQIQWDRSSEEAQHELVLVDTDSCQPTARLPILGDTLSHVLKRVSGSEGSAVSITLQPILTQQPQPHGQDTHVLLPLLAKIVELWQPELTKLTCLDPWIITSDPSDTGAMWRLYGEDFYDRYQKLAPQYDRRYIQTAPGTPAMSFAAATFARDPDLVFLYTPYGGGTRQTSGLADLRKAETDRLVAGYLDRLAWDAAAGALEAPGNGYTPLAGDHPRQVEITKMHALDAWQRRQYDVAQEHLSKLPNGMGSKETTNLIELCAVLANPNNPANGWAGFWLQAMVDAINRLAVARSLEDEAGCLLAVYAFNDSCLTYGLADAFPGLALPPGACPAMPDSVQGRVEEMFLSGYQNLMSETAKVQVLWATHERNRPEWFERYLLLHWPLQNGFDDLRNSLVHGTIHLSGNVLGERLKKLGVDNAASAVDCFLGLLHGILEKLPQPVDKPFAIAAVHDGIRPTTPTILPEVVREKTQQVVETFKKARHGSVKDLKAELQATQARVIWQFEDAIRMRFPETFRNAAANSLVTVSNRLLVDPEPLAHGLVSRNDPERPFVEGILRTLANANVKPFTTLSQHGKPDTRVRYVKDWLNGGQWSVVDLYIEQLRQNQQRTGSAGRSSSSAANKGVRSGSPSASPSAASRSPKRAASASGARGATTVMGEAIKKAIEKPSSRRS